VMLETRESIKVAGKEVRLQIQRKRVRHAYLRLGPDFTLRLVIPLQTKIAPEEILEKKRRWIEEKVGEVSRMRRVLTEDYVLLEGRHIPIKELASAKPEVRLERRILHVYVPHDLDRNRLISEFLAARTRELVSGLVPKLARTLHVQYGTLSVREMKRWGQCTRDGDLRFSDKLICLPSELAEYVVLHELVHLKHFNHSKAFFKEISRHCARYKDLDRELRMYIA